MNSEDFRMANRHVSVLMVCWIAGTILAVVAASLAPTAPPASITSGYLDSLSRSWGWYAGAYGLFFVTDSAIALLGASLCAWLKPRGTVRGQMIIGLFLLSGVLGMLADVQMIAAAQVFRSGWLSAENAGAFLNGVNTSTNWLSVASFLPPAVGTWLLCEAAQETYVRRGWIALTKFAAVYQGAVGVISAAAFFSQEIILNGIALTGALIGLPILTVVWLGWAIGEMKKQIRP